MLGPADELRALGPYAGLAHTAWSAAALSEVYGGEGLITARLLAQVRDPPISIVYHNIVPLVCARVAA